MTSSKMPFYCIQGETGNTLDCNQSKRRYYSITTATAATKDSRHIFYRSRVIAHFVRHFVLPWQRGSVGAKFGWQRLTAQPRKPPIDPKILQIFFTEAELLPISSHCAAAVISVVSAACISVVTVHILHEVFDSKFG